MLNDLGREMQMHVMAVEYPGYGLYKQSGPNEDKMREDCETIYDYLTQVAGVREEDVIVFGRSMGSGPTSFLSSLKKPYCIVLLSPFMSIKDATKDLFALGGMMSKVV